MTTQEQAGPYCCKCGQPCNVHQLDNPAFNANGAQVCDVGCTGVSACCRAHYTMREREVNMPIKQSIAQQFLKDFSADEAAEIAVQVNNQQEAGTFYYFGDDSVLHVPASSAFPLTAGWEEQSALT